MPLDHVPLTIAFVLGTCSQQNTAWQRDVLAARVQHATGPNIPHPCCIPVNMVLRVHLYQQPTYMPPMTATGDRPMSGLHYVAPGNRLQLGCGEARFIAHGVCWAGTFPFFPARRQWNFWTHWDLSPGPSACGADVMPLHHVPFCAWPRVDGLLQRCFGFSRGHGRSVACCKVHCMSPIRH